MKWKEIFETIRKIGKEMGIWAIVGIMAIALFSGIAAATGSVHNMNTSEDFTSIQAAIDNASAGNEIHVDSGIYYENVNVNKQLVLKGIDTGGGRPIIYRESIGHVITIVSNGSIFEGFNITNSYIGDGHSYAGISIASNNNIIRSNDILNDDFYGISMQVTNPAYNRIENNNIFILNYRGGAGIQITYSDYSIL